MNNELFLRTGGVLGQAAVKKLNESKVAIFGLGGVGSYVAEALARTGVGSFVLIDKDVVEVSNINRQLIATTENIGMLKTEAEKQRILAINPDASVETCPVFYLENSGGSLIEGCDYVVDAIDNVTAKIALIKECKEFGVPFISAMGAANRTDPTAFKIADISKTSTCPLCRVVRRELRAAGVKDVKVAYSTEIPVPSSNGELGSLAFATGAMGLLIAKEVVFQLLGGHYA